MRSSSDIGWVLWAGTIGMESRIPSRIEAAQAAGFSRLSLSPMDVVRAQEQGTSPADLGAQIRDAGLEIILDPVMNWSGGAPATGSQFGRFSSEEALRMGAELQVASITAHGQRHGGVSLEAMVWPFGALCDRAADFGAQLQLEFIPMTEIKDLASAWAIVQAADRPNAGIVFDTWHFFRGNPDYQVLRQVPGERIFAVQIDDALAQPRADLWQDTQHRLLPGDGTFDLPRILSELHTIGGLSWIGPEIISPVTAAMPAVEAAQLAGSRVRDLVATACASE